MLALALYSLLMSGTCLRLNGRPTADSEGPMPLSFSDHVQNDESFIVNLRDGASIRYQF
jgi:hypothetical protein